MASHSTIGQRLFVLVAIPLAVLAVAVALLLQDAWTQYRSAGTTQAALRVAVAAGDLVHALQIERGATAGFLQSKGAKFADLLPNIRSRSDALLEAFRKEAGAGASASLPELMRAVAAAEGPVGAIGALRPRADNFSLPVAEEVASYSAAVAALTGVIAASGGYSSSPAIVRKSSAYLALVKAKEQSGQERALATAAFSADTVESARLRQILERIDRQEAYFDLFRSTAGEDEAAAVQAVLQSEAARQVDGMRAVLIEKAATGGFGIDPAVWFKAMTAKIDGLHSVETAVAANIGSRSAEIVNANRNRLLGLAAAAVLTAMLVIVVSFRISRGVSRPLKGQMEVAEFAIRENDFTRDVPEAGPVEVVRAGRAFNQLMHKFRQIVADMKHSSERVTAAVHLLAASSRQVQESASAESDAAANVAAAVQQASVSVSETASNAEAAARLVESSRADTDAAVRVMGEAVANMRRIAHLITTSSEHVTALDRSSRQIGGIVEVIREIAEQTNLLALNAAIEAARAGEQGRGFAVVADEVRKLAERTASATGEIASLIQSIQSGVAGSVESMKEANSQADASLDLVGQTESALNRIGEGAQNVSDTVRLISDALKEQDAAIHQVAVSIETIAQMTDENSHATEANNRTAADLDRLALELRESVAGFKA